MEHDAEGGCGIRGVSFRRGDWVVPWNDGELAVYIHSKGIVSKES